METRRHGEKPTQENQLSNPGDEKSTEKITRVTLWRENKSIARKPKSQIGFLRDSVSPWWVLDPLRHRPRRQSRSQRDNFPRPLRRRSRQRKFGAVDHFRHNVHGIVALPHYCLRQSGRELQRLPLARPILAGEPHFGDYLAH